MGEFDALRPFTVRWVAAQPAIQEMAERVGMSPLAFAEASIPLSPPAEDAEAARLAREVDGLRREVSAIQHRPAPIASHDANALNEMKRIRSHVEQRLAAMEQR